MVRGALLLALVLATAAGCRAAAVREHGAPADRSTSHEIPQAGGGGSM
jgi:hypothetical protein